MKFIKWFAFILIFIPLLASSQLYYWVDENGVKHYSSEKPSNSEHVSNYMEIETTPLTPVIEKKDTVEVPAEEEIESVVIQNKFIGVIMYSKGSVEDCIKARKFFEENGVPYTDFDVEKIPRRMDEFKKLGGTGYPLIIAGETKIQGFNESVLRKTLGMDKQKESP